jgi:hypothetical protein
MRKAVTDVISQNDYIDDSRLEEIELRVPVIERDDTVHITVFGSLVENLVKYSLGLTNEKIKPKSTSVVKSINLHEKRYDDFIEACKKCELLQIKPSREEQKLCTVKTDTLSGEIDMVHDDTIYDIKCCSKTKLVYWSNQVLTYRNMYEELYRRKVKDCFVMNFYDGKVYRLCKNPTISTGVEIPNVIEIPDVIEIPRVVMIPTVIEIPPFHVQKEDYTWMKIFIVMALLLVLSVFVLVNSS